MGNGLSDIGLSNTLRMLYVMMMGFTFVISCSYSEITTGSVDFFTWTRLLTTLVLPLIILGVVAVILTIIAGVLLMYDKTVEAKKLKSQD